MIETVQKIIQIGSSEGVTLSKKNLDRLGAKRGDSLKLKIELADGLGKHQELMQQYDAFVEKYGQTLKNLADK
ncbi:MAG TPA: AbrB family transcriptional regulator [Candidatus Binatia bacterium]|jgi:antitoxin component of MazEF toxin-antitoxin module|nr:AbrB family transcriptional regulator [Candidatus Binatia bacterium]